MRSPAATLLLLALAMAAPPAASAVSPGDPPSSDASPSDVGEGSPANRITVEHQEAIDRALAWLATQQDTAGGFPTRPPEGLNKSAAYQTAVTALCTLSFLGAGHGLGRGLYREKVRKSVEWLLKAQDDRGYISWPGDDQSKMHGHGYATMALAEAFATAGSDHVPKEDGGEIGDRDLQSSRDFTKRLKAGIQRAVDLIESSQRSIGGWGYQPGVSQDATDHEGSITVCEVQALLAASNRGFVVDMGRIQRARKYMKDSQVSCGGFKYRITEEENRDNPRTYSWALASAGVVSLVGLAEFDRKDAIDRGVAFMEYKDRVERDGRGGRDGGTAYLYYGTFYATQAYHWIGGEKWERFWTSRLRWLLRSQEPAGCWEGQDTQINLGPAYPTAMCLLMLEVPVGYLSIYAR